MLSNRFDEDDHEPAAVVRTLADLSLMLVLMFSMIVGSNRVSTSNSVVEAHAVVKNPGTRAPDVIIALTEDGEFLLPLLQDPLTASDLAAHLENNGKSVNSILLKFPPDALASRLHAALLQLEGIFPSATIQTMPGK